MRQAFERIEHRLGGGGPLFPQTPLGRRIGSPETRSIAGGGALLRYSDGTRGYPDRQRSDRSAAMHFLQCNMDPVLIFRPFTLETQLSPCWWRPPPWQSRGNGRRAQLAAPVLSSDLRLRSTRYCPPSMRPASQFADMPRLKPFQADRGSR